MYSSHHSKCETLNEPTGIPGQQLLPMSEEAGPLTQTADGLGSLGWHLQLLQLIALMISMCTLLLACTARRIAMICNPSLSTVGPEWLCLAVKTPHFPCMCFDDIIQNVQPWEPRTFVLPDPAYQGLLQHLKEAGYDQADFQP